jgi:hypothetical protein
MDAFSASEPKTRNGKSFLSLTKLGRFNKFKGREALHTSGWENNCSLVVPWLRLTSLLIGVAKDISFSHPPTLVPHSLLLLVRD